MSFAIRRTLSTLHSSSYPLLCSLEEQDSPFPHSEARTAVASKPQSVITEPTAHVPVSSKPFGEQWSCFTHSPYYSHAEGVYNLTTTSTGHGKRTTSRFCLSSLWVSYSSSPRDLFYNLHSGYRTEPSSNWTQAGYALDKSPPSRSIQNPSNSRQGKQLVWDEFRSV